MNKRLVTIIGGVVVLLVIAGAVFIFQLKKAPSVISPVGELEKEPEVKLATWEDPAGFSFSYPQDLEIDSHEEDRQNYAHLELTSADREGKILIWVKDTNYSTIDAWVKGEAGEKEQIFDTELSGEPAKKVAYSEPGKLVTATIDVDALVLVEMFPDEEGYWQGVYDQVLTSFTFVPLEGEEAVAPAPWEGPGEAGGIIEEPEEMIE